MRKPGINMTVGVVLLVIAFGISAPVLWGAAQVVKPDEVPGAQVDNGAAGGATGEDVTLTVVSNNIRFDTNEIVVSAGVEVTIIHENRDGGIPHNLAFFTDRTMATVIFRSDLVTGPIIDEFTFTAPASPGTYFFHCDAHPEMQGNFVVQ